MLGRRNEINLQLNEAVDALLIVVAFFLAHLFRTHVPTLFFTEAPGVPSIKKFLWILTIVAPLTPIVLETMGYYQNILHKTVGRSFRQLFKALVYMGMVVGACVVFFRFDPQNRTVLILAAFLAIIFLLVKELFLKHLLRKMLKDGSRGRERAILTGNTDDIATFLDHVNSEFLVETEVVAQIDLSDKTVDDLICLLHDQSISRVIFCMNHIHFAKVEEAVIACETEGVECCLSVDFIKTAIARPTVDYLGGQPMLIFRAAPGVSWSMTLKNSLDCLGALVLIVASSPFWLLAAIGIRLSDKRGAIFYTQERSGKNGRPFRMVKFRTMYSDAEARQAEIMAKNEMDGPVFKVTNDPRIIPFGHFLRKFSIDELPQLINVLRGEMSLVGPRPLPVYEVKRIEHTAQRRRMSVKPGLTCLWQVSGRNRITSFEQWVQLDLKYIDNWSLWLDLKILAMTVPSVLRGSGAS